MSFIRDLEAAKRKYPFDRWRENYQQGLEQYTPENCGRAKEIFDNLIEGLVALGSDASVSDKMSKFKEAVLALNVLNDELEGSLIETAEREDLCELCNVICLAVNVEPAQYGDGEGPASEWREW